MTSGISYDRDRDSMVTGRVLLVVDDGKVGMIGGGVSFLADSDVGWQVMGDGRRWSVVVRLFRKLSGGGLKGFRNAKNRVDRYPFSFVLARSLCSLRTLYISPTPLSY